MICMRVAFRTDASSQIGTGHVMRCLTLADALREESVECQFVCREHEGHLMGYIRSRGYQLHALSTPQVPDPFVSDLAHASWLDVDWKTDAAQTRQVLGSEPLDWLIVDHYALDLRWESALRSSCKHIMVIDDLADRQHDCDILVDPGAEPDLPARYKKLVPQAAKLFIGPRFALLRKEFDFYRESNVCNASEHKVIVPKRLLVMFGGNDKEGHTLEALVAIAHLAPKVTQIDVVVSAINQDHQRIESFCLKHDNFKIHKVSEKIALLMARADFVIGSGGGSTWERLYLRRPSLVKVVAENQRKPLESLADEGLLALYCNRGELEKALRQVFLEGAALPPDLVRNGVPAITKTLIHDLLCIQAPCPLDVRRTYHWLQDRELRRHFLMRGGEPTRRNHFQYWRGLLSNPEQLVFSIYEGCRHIGSAGLRNINKASSSAELWLYLGDQNKRGKGRGKIILKELETLIRNHLGYERAFLHVSKLNIPAMRLYSGSGYQISALQDAEAVGFEASDEVVRMEKIL